MKDELIRLEQASVAIDDVKILDNLRFNVYSGEIMSVVSNSSRDLSVLGNVLTGQQQLDTGYLFFEDVLQKTLSPEQVSKLGIFHIERESKIIHSLSVMQNLFSFRIEAPLVISYQAYLSEFTALHEKFGLEFSGSALAGTIENYNLIILEILKAYVNDARLIIVDDILFEYPPGVLEKFYSLFKKLQDEGISIVLFRRSVDNGPIVPDRMLLLRNGTAAYSALPGELEAPFLLRVLHGINQKSSFKYAQTEISKDAFATLQSIPASNSTYFSQQICKGEILGIFDIENIYTNTSTYEFITDISSGRFNINMSGKAIRIRSIADAAKHGIYFFQDGITSSYLFDNLTIGQNLIVNLKKPGLANQFFPGKFSRFLQNEFAKAHNISPNTSISKLSLKERYELLLYKFSLLNPTILFCIHPFVQIDDSLKDVLYMRLKALAAQGSAITVFSSNVYELSSLCDTILVIYKKREAICMTNAEFRSFKPETFY